MGRIWKSVWWLRESNFRSQLLADSHDPVTSHLTLRGVICVPEVAWPFHSRKNPGVRIRGLPRWDFSHDEGIAMQLLPTIMLLELIVGTISISKEDPLCVSFHRSRICVLYLAYMRDVESIRIAEEWVGIKWRDAESE